jgi:hypothetical protein
MSVVGSPIETSLLQAAQAQQTASKARDRERATAESARRFKDLVELRVAGTESSEAIRKLPQNDSEQAESEHDAHDQGAKTPPEPDRPHIDVTA